MGDNDGDFDAHFQIIRSAGERTRALLYFLGLVGAALLVAVVEFDVFPWAQIREEAISKAHLCFTYSYAAADNVPGEIDKDPCGKYYDYVRGYFIYGVQVVPKDTTSKHQGQTLGAETYEALSERYKALIHAYIDSTAIPIPVLGIRMDAGNVFIFASMIISMLLAVLRLSLLNELKCLVSAHELGLFDGIYKIWAVTNSHIFSSAHNTPIFWWFLYIPTILIAYDIGISNYDIVASFKETAKMFSSSQILLWYHVAQASCFILILVVTMMCHRAAIRLDQKLRELDELGTVSV